MQAEALRDWVLDRLEATELWSDDNGPRVLSVAALANTVRADAELRGVLDLLAGRAAQARCLGVGLGTAAARGRRGDPRNRGAAEVQAHRLSGHGVLA